MPSWVNEGTQTYAKYLSRYAQFHLIELPINGNILKVVPKQSYLIALDPTGTKHSSESLSQSLANLQQIHPHLCFVIGGPDGLEPEVIQQAHTKWSLSPLTFPHPLCRLVLLEALYRALSMLQGHPYHR